MSQRDCDYLLSGIVEMDDTYLGAAEEGGKRGRGTSKVSVMAALSKGDDGRPYFLIMKVMENLRGETVGAFAKKNIKEGSTIQSDSYHSYKKPLSENYNHE